MTITGETVREFTTHLTGCVALVNGGAIIGDQATAPTKNAPASTQATSTPPAWLDAEINEAPVAPVTTPPTTAPVSGLPPTTATPATAQYAQAITPPPVTAPPTTAPSYTMDQIARAGADLIEAQPALMDALMAMLPKYGVQALSQLQPDQYGAVAIELRAMGAKI